MLVQPRPAAGRSQPLSTFSLSLLVLITLVALVPRLFDQNWDGGHYAHPDELHIVQVASERLSWPSEISGLLPADSSPMNPRRLEDGNRLSYSYGSLLVYGLKALSSVVAVLTGEPAYASFDRIYRVGRPVSALADVGTVLALFALGRRLFDTHVGLLAAAFSALTVLQVQYSHYYVAEPLMTLFLTLALLYVVRSLQTGARGSALAAGLFMGLAVATKPSAAAFATAGLLILAFGGAVARSDSNASSHRTLLIGARHGLQLCLLAGLAALLAWAVWEPYVVANFAAYLDNIRSESRIQAGDIDLPYTRQYIGTVPVWYHFSQYVRWGVGLPLGIAVLAGLSWGMARATRRDTRVLVLLAWITPYMLCVLTLEAKWLRYMLPVTPVLLLLASAALWGLLDRLRAVAGTGSYVRARIGYLAMAAVLVGSALWVAAFARIYTRPHTWVQASEWMYANIPSGASIGVEHWDRELPLNLPGRSGGDYERVSIEMYDDLAPSEKLLQVEQALASSDYIVLASNRLYGSIPRSPWRYAVATRYYELLFEERLGFRKVASFVESPGLGSRRVSETSADESFSVYDHPPVTIFRKERNVASWELQALFADAVEAPWVAERHGEADKSLLLTPLRQGYERALPYFSGSFTGAAAVASWLLVLELLGLATWILLLPILSGLPDRGWVLSKLIGVLATAWFVWWAASLEMLPATPGVARTNALILVCAALATSLARRRAVRRDLGSAWRAMLGFELLFLGLFAAGALLRAANPDLWHPIFGGEKPMELAFLNGVLRSSRLPPYDPWYSGGYINYYYFGQWLAAHLMRLASVGPQYGFSLAVATVWAWTGTLSAAIGYTLARQWGRGAAGVVGGLSLLFVLLVGNLDGGVQLIQSMRDDGVAELWRTFDFWRSTRLEGAFFIHEFPFFTFLYGDLHAHMIAMPLGLALVLLGAFLVARRELVSARDTIVVSVLGGLLAGALVVTNPWDVPAYTGLFALATTLYWACSGDTLRRRATGALASLGIVALVAGIGYFPFFRSFKSFYGEIGLVTTPTRPTIYLNMLGLFLFLAGWHAVTRAWHAGPRARAATLGLPLLLAAAVLLRGSEQWVLVLLLSLLSWLLLAAWHDRRSAPALVWTGLAAGGTLIWAGIEVLYLKDFLEGSDWYRQNTIFKFGLQSWLLLALGCAGLLYLSLSGARSRLARLGPMAIVTVLVAASLVYPVYGTAARVRYRFPEPPTGATLDGEAYMRTATLQNESGRVERYGDDYEAILWMRENIREPATIVEAGIGPYRGNGGRISAFTGLPAVVGWDNHESQQRYPEPVARRNADVRDLYNSPSPRRALEVVLRYDVRYIYVGPVERLHEFGDASNVEPYGSRRGLAKFDRMAREGVLDVAYSNRGVTVYEVPPTWRWSADRLVHFAGADG